MKPRPLCSEVGCKGRCDCRLYALALTPWHPLLPWASRGPAATHPQGDLLQQLQTLGRVHVQLCVKGCRLLLQNGDGKRQMYGSQDFMPSWVLACPCGFKGILAASTWSLLSPVHIHLSAQLLALNISSDFRPPSNVKAIAFHRLHLGSHQCVRSSLYNISLMAFHSASLIKLYNCLLFSCLVAKSFPTLCHPMDCRPPGSSVHGILQARVLERVANSFSRGSS